MVAPLLVQLGITGGIIAGRYIYHRLTDEEPLDPKERIRVARTAEGDPIPLVFGRCRISSPVIAWHGGATASNSGPSPSGVFFQLRMLFVIGIPFQDGVTRLEKIYLGDYEAIGIPVGLDHDDASSPSNVIGSPTIEADDLEFLQAEVQFQDGRATQDIATASAATVALQVYSLVSPDRIPGYRGYMTFFADVGKWTPSLPQFHFEVKSLPGINYFADGFGIGIGTIGEDANPGYVIASVICDSFGKLGLPKARLDWPSFQRSIETLSAEGHGYSRAWDSRSEASQIIDEVLRQTDGVMYEEPTTGLIVYKLIRADYDPLTILEVNPSNCEEVSNFAAGGWTNTINKVRVVFQDRADGYRENSATAQNMANAVGQDGETREAVVQFPGCCTRELAETLAARELAARSRPVARCRVKVDRRFWNARPGDAVSMVWPKLNVSNRVFRIASLSRGMSSENSVYLDLIEDYFYVYRRRVSGLPPVAPFPGETDILIE